MAGLTLAEFFDTWWRLHAEPNLEPATLRLYRGMWERHARLRLGPVALEELSPLALVQFRTDLEADGVGPEAIRKTLSMLQGVLQRAVEWQLVEVNAAKVVRKPPSGRLRAVQPIGPEAVETMRRELLDRGRERNAILLGLLAYAGLRPQEALALEWRHVRERTLVVEQALSDGRVKGLKNRRRPRAVDLLDPLRRDLAAWRATCGDAIAGDSPVVPNNAGGYWRDTDWRNWRRRVFKPAAAAAGLEATRPYDLRHAFVSLLIHEGRWSVVEIAGQLGHTPTVCLDIYAHELAERRGEPGVGAEERIWAARARAESECRPHSFRDRRLVPRAP